jgi:hypothetical protein
VKLRAEIESEVHDRRIMAARIEEQVTAAEHEVERKQTEVERREQGLNDRARRQAAPGGAEDGETTRRLGEPEMSAA